MMGQIIPILSGKDFLVNIHLFFSCIIFERLIASLQQWQNDQRTSAWLWIPIEKAYVIPIAAELGRERMFDNYEICIDIEGFTYHNAEERTAVLNKWLLPTKSLIPRFATYVKYSFEYE